MSLQKPTVSIIIATYNRGGLFKKAIKSIEAQTFQDFEIILVNNGSTDDTAPLMEQYKGHGKVRCFHLSENRGWAAGYNFAFDQIRGEWFAVLGDDDEIKPGSLELMLKVVEEIDPSIDAVTANSININTGKFDGQGLDRDQYLPIEKIIQKTSGEFFGITKTALLGDKRYNENLHGDSDTFYYKIDAIANRYYIHKALKTWGTPNVANESARYRQHNLAMRVKLYHELLNEPFYWDVILKYNKKQYIARCLRGMFFQKTGGNEKDCQTYMDMLALADLNFKQALIAKCIEIIPASTLHVLYGMLENKSIMNYLSGFFVKRYSTMSN